MSILAEKIKILYSDESIAVAVKPRGMVSELSGKPGESFPEALKSVLSLKTIYPVHRLDRETEGIMVYALSPAAAAALSESIQNGQFVKEYDALIHGVPSEPEAVLEDLLFKDTRTSKVYVVRRERKGVRKAVLSYRTVKAIELQVSNGSGAREAATQVHIRLGTGRTHQIRVQFASRRLPLLGDRRYGAGDNYPPIALCATSLTFPHPRDGRTMSFEIPFNYPLP